MTAAAESVMTALDAERGRFLAFARGRVGVDAEDVLQAAMLRAATRAETLRDPALVVPWFFRILRNAVAEHRSKARPVAVEVDDTLAADDDAPAEVCDCALNALPTLRPEYAEILRHAVIEEESLAECAEALGTTKNNAAVRLHRARGALRQALAACCGDHQGASCVDCGCGC